MSFRRAAARPSSSATLRPRAWFLLLAGLSCCGCWPGALSDEVPLSGANCSQVLSSAEKTMIRAYEPQVQQLLSTITTGSYQGLAYEELSKWVDRFGARMSGSEALEQSIDYLRDSMEAIPGYRLVHTESVTLPNWLRGPEWAELLEPWQKTIDVMALQFSASTSPLVLRAEVVLCYGNSDLAASPNKFLGRIVANFGECDVEKLAAAGAKAVLKGSGFGLSTLHRFRLRLNKMSRPILGIPIAAITQEDMTLFDRVSKLGKRLLLKLCLNEPHVLNVTSRNLLGDYPGRSKKLRRKLVGVASHLDSWDVGQGAQDDGFGLFLGMLMVRLFNELGLRPRRTIRSLFMTGEELGLLGSKAYAATHAQDMSDYQAVFEADVGLELTGVLYHGTLEFGCLLNEILDLVRRHIPSVTLSYRQDWRSDLDNFKAKQVPTAGLAGGPRYRWFTHAQADTMTSVQSSQLDRQFAVYASVVYVVADMRISCSRLDDTSPPKPRAEQDGS